ncbi:SIR2 family NAD-dependent protein deacylase [Limihaloglobus sulfuriphilus]|nr:Sir2 family NAD-dependent protein deacetylase [Limihaloglobus sulfuriphilus]
MQSISPEKCAEFIREGGVAAFTGAGISTAAGIPDFRGKGGFYSTGRYNPDTVFEIEYFKTNPKPFYDFSRDMLEIVDRITPTFTHFFLAQLEEMGLLSSLSTQNIDPLHQMAGSKNVICIHGSYSSMNCLRCGKYYGLDASLEYIRSQDVPRCGECGGLLKPDVVFFGEQVHGMNEAMQEIAESKTLLVLGSSLVVYPAAILPQWAKRAVVVNRTGVSIPTVPEQYMVERELDDFFRQVAEYVF